MNLLFVHQNFPGQFRHLAPHLARAGHRVEALGIDGPGLPGITLHRYRPGRASSPNIHPYAQEYETKVIRGEACAAAAAKLRDAGFAPDVIIANPGWGESLFLKDLWPRAKMLAYLEFFYGAYGLDYDFDPEFARPGLAQVSRLRAKNAHLLLALADMDWGIAPTEFQRSTLPAPFRDRVSVIFDGVDTQAVRPDATASFAVGERRLHAGEEIVTFVNRNLEPYRGYHIFLRALPEILRRRPNAVALIIGGEGVSYGAAPPAGSSWKQIFYDEVKDRIDPARVHLLGRLPHAEYLRVLQVSACHVYLTYPFVLGWSCIEALAAGCLVIGSRTAPVEEVIAHGSNGLLTDFFDIAALADAVVNALAHPERYQAMRATARQLACERYDLATVSLPAQLQLLRDAGKIR